jgi:hypothetical protein
MTIQRHAILYVLVGSKAAVNSQTRSNFDLEAFSHSSTDDGLATLRHHTIANTTYLVKVFLSY